MEQQQTAAVADGCVKELIDRFSRSEAAISQQHVAEHGWDDCGNLAGSALMLNMLRPLVFGLPWDAPLRIFGMPPPTALLALEGIASSQRPHDNYRTNCIEGLLGHFRQVGDRVRGDLLQDCWWLMKVAIAQWNWERLPAWQIPRLSLNLQAPTALTG